MKNAERKIVAAKHIRDYIVMITFSDKKIVEIDFTKPFEYYCKGDYAKWKTPSNFKKFKIEYSNIVWGKNWDIIFDINEIYLNKIKVPSIKQHSNNKMKSESLLNSFK